MTGPAQCDHIKTIVGSTRRQAHAEAVRLADVCFQGRDDHGEIWSWTKAIA